MDKLLIFKNYTDSKIRNWKGNGDTKQCFFLQ